MPKGGPARQTVVVAPAFGETVEAASFAIDRRCERAWRRIHRAGRRSDSVLSSGAVNCRNVQGGATRLMLAGAFIPLAP
jgi:hypothetical protein